VPQSVSGDELIRSRPVVLVLRLVLDRQARLQHGDVLDAEANGQGRFASLTEMNEIVRRWIDQQRVDAERPP
jgi:hypothetical protein